MWANWTQVPVCDVEHLDVRQAVLGHDAALRCPGSQRGCSASASAAAADAAGVPAERHRRSTLVGGEGALERDRAVRDAGRARPEVERPRVLARRSWRRPRGSRCGAGRRRTSTLPLMANGSGTSYRMLAIRRTCWPSTSSGTTGVVPQARSVAESDGMAFGKPGHRVDGDLVDDRAPDERPLAAPRRAPSRPSSGARRSGPRARCR